MVRRVPDESEQREQLVGQLVAMFFEANFLTNEVKQAIIKNSRARDEPQNTFWIHFDQVLKNLSNPGNKVLVLNTLDQFRKKWLSETEDLDQETIHAIETQLLLTTMRFEDGADHDLWVYVFTGTYENFQTELANNLADFYRTRIEGRIKNSD